MRAFAPLLPLFLVGCGGDPCGDEVQWAPFAVQDTFETLCAGDAVEVRPFMEGYIVDLNTQFAGIAGEGAVSGAWTLAFDGALWDEGSAAEVPSYDAGGGWYRVHTTYTLTQEASVIEALDGSEATVSATFTDASGAVVSGSLDLVATVTE